MPLEASREQPQPLHRVIEAVGGWVARCGEIWVEAQIVELKRRSAATQFLTIRDLTQDYSAQVTTTRYVLDAAGPLPEGSHVIARLKPRVWTRNTSLSFECLEIQVAGEGRLLAQLAALSRKMQAEGLFEAYRKNPLPTVPRVIGLITGKNSDAERDVAVNVGRRWPAATIRTEHALVQGPKSAASIMEALLALDRAPEVDVIIIARGGGALEDLLSFSDEGLVRAVAAAKTPVISAIGHENDSPILDLVADRRASTPTDAAKIVVPDREHELLHVTQARARLNQALDRILRDQTTLLTQLRNNGVMQDPTAAYDAHYARLHRLRDKLDYAISRFLTAQQHSLERATSRVRDLSPRSTLQRGYAVLIDTSRNAITSVDEAAPGARLTALLADGSVDLDVVSTTPKESHG